MTKVERAKLRDLYWELRKQTNDVASTSFSAGVSAGLNVESHKEKQLRADAAEETMRLLLDELRELSKEPWERSG